MNKLYKIIGIPLIISSILITGVAIYGYNYGWGATIVIYHDESENYYPPVTIFEMWDEGMVAHRTFLMFPRKLYPPKLIMLTTTKKESIVRESYLAFWIVMLIYVLGWFFIVRYIVKKRNNI